MPAPKKLGNDPVVVTVGETLVVCITVVPW